MFEVVGQDIISGNMGFIGTDSDGLYRMGAAEKTEDITVTGNPAVLDNATGKPFKDLHIYGRSEQMTTTGAQLIDINSFQKNNDISVKIVNNYSIELTSTIKKDASDSSRVYLNAAIDADVLVGKTITMSYDGWNSNVPNEVAVCGIMYNINGENNYEHISSDSRIKTVTIPLSAKDCKVRLFLIERASATVKAGTYTAIIKGLMVCEGTVAKSWEPYTGGKPSPSPDYPQEIVSAGEDGNLNVMVRGKNIFPGPEQPKTVERNGLTFSYKDGMYTLTGTSNKDTWFNIYPVIDKTTSTTLTHNGNTICSDGKIAVVNGLKNKLCNIAFRNVDNKDANTSITASDNKKMLQHNTSGVFIYARSGSYSDTFTLMITSENQAEDYEPYHTPQTLTLSTPNGLPGIPVTSGGNYTDENGQQWICDEVDLGRGVYVQRIASFVINAKNANDIYVTNLYTHVTVAVNARISTPEETSNSLETRSNRNLFCEALPWTADEWSSTVNSMGFVENSMVDFTVENSYLGLSEASTNDERKAALVKYFTDKPCQIVYRIATPIETTLTAAEISAYKSLRSYRGTTIVEAEDKAGISVTYKRNAKAAEKEVNILHADLMAEMEELDENSEIV